MKTNLLLWILLLPMFGSAFHGILLLFGKKLPRETTGTITSLISIGTFVASVLAFFMLQGLPSRTPQLRTPLYTWLQVGSFQVDLTLLLDPLSAMMLLIITGISSLVHIYSIGYMRGDPGSQRYFSYLNLSLFAMLLLVLGDSPVTMLIGWQGVGLSSFLLIGFWFEDRERTKAGMKAFLVNRIGDLGLSIGIFILFWGIYPHLQAGESLSFATIRNDMRVLQDTLIFGLSAVEVSAFCLFIGVMAKSAQIPLHIWLPDAVAAPTPVSALIHASTTVIGGVYVVVRFHFLYSAAPATAHFLAGVGALTAFFAACIGLFQNDIKKILAYSTISQLGLVSIGIGVGAYSAGVFHLATHAFFKALLFLGAGSVILSMNHEQDIRKMGGLFRYMKVTGFAFLVGTLAMVGFPGFSGFFSQNKVLWKVFATQHPVIWVMGTLSVLMTAFYMTRMFCLVFLGELRTSPDALVHFPEGKPQETKSVMTIPMLILAVFSAIGGLVGIPYFLTYKNSVFDFWLMPLFAKGLANHPHAKELVGQASQHSHLLFGEGAAMGITVLLMLIGIGVAFLLYMGTAQARQSIERETRLQQPNTGGVLGRAYRMVYNAFYLDKLYEAAIIRPILQLSRDGLWPFDQFVVDGIVNLTSRLTQKWSRALSWWQTGYLKVYLFSMAVGLISLLVWFMVTGTSQ